MAFIRFVLRRNLTRSEVRGQTLVMQWQTVLTQGSWQNALPEWPDLFNWRGIVADILSPLTWPWGRSFVVLWRLNFCLVASASRGCIKFNWNRVYFWNDVGQMGAYFRTFICCLQRDILIVIIGFSAGNPRWFAEGYLFVFCWAQRGVFPQGCRILCAVKNVFFRNDFSPPSCPVFYWYIVGFFSLVYNC